MQAFPQIDGYRITRLIGQGGMARVYAAVEAELEREVAIKVVRLDPDRDAEIASRLEFEARSLARLRHPHIVELYRFGRLSTSALYYVMPLLSGGDLGHWLKPVAEVKVRALLCDLLDALGHAHQAGIVHRDVKPENILFDQHGRVQLADFGAAFALETASSTTSRLTQEGFAVGSLGYMSPEQARGQGVSGLSDLYSLAVVAFELLTDTRCHIGNDAVAIALAQIEQPPAQLPTELAHWQSFFACALDPNPHQRYPSAAVMKAALPKLLSHAGAANADSMTQLLVGGSAVTSTTRVMPATQVIPARKVFKKWLLVTLLAVLSASGMAWYTWDKSQQQLQFERLQSQLDQAPENRAAELLSKSASDLSAAQTSVLARKIMQRMLTTIQRLALAEGDAAANLNAIAAPWATLDLLRRKYQLANSAELAELETSLTRRVEETLILATEQFDRATAQKVMPLAQALASTQTKLSPTMQRAANIPEVGGEFIDLSGIRMRLVSLPTGKNGGLAIMANALTAVEFERYAAAVKLRPGACTYIAPVRGCMDQKQANAIATWFSTQSSSPLSLPSKDQWQQARAYAPLLKGSFAASNECHMLSQSQRPNVVKRTWGNIKSVFGGQKAQSIATRSCHGASVFALDGSGKSTVASVEKTVLVLVKVLR